MIPFWKRIDLFHRILSFIRFPVAPVDQSGDRCDAGESQHRRVVLSQQTFVHLPCGCRSA
jgi:hypothetical protein